MKTDIESRVAATLRADADRVVQVTGLREGAIARAGGIRRRRRMLTGVVGVWLTAVIGVGIVVAPRALPNTGAAADASGSAAVPTVGSGSTGAAGGAGPTSAPGPTSLPELTDVPSAARQPAAVGTDPAVLHFDVNLALLGAEVSDWTAGKGYESVAIPDRSGGRQVEILLGPDAAVLEEAKSPPGQVLFRGRPGQLPPSQQGPEEPTTVNGRPGTLQKVVELPGTAAAGTSWLLRWQPMAGLHVLVQVFGDDPAPGRAAAAAIRLDHAQRCAVPVRLDRVPAGATWTQCRTSVRRSPLGARGVWVLSWLILEQPGGARMSVWVEEARRGRHPSDEAAFAADRTVAGHPAQWRTSDPKGLWLLNFGAAEVFVEAAGLDQAVRLVEGLRVADDLARPQSWPQRAVG